MRSNAEPSFTLRSHLGATPPALTGVEARGRLDGVLFSLTLRQTYRNAGPDPLEVIYSFPLPAEAALLGLAAEFGGRRLEGRVLPRQKAEAEYEQALDKGDAPVLLEVSGNGVYTANLGNLNPGESVTLEVRFAQLLAFEQGRLRVAIPTTIAPRYGNAVRAGLQPHQVPEASLDVEYPLAVTLAVGASLARARIECPTHAHRVEPCGDEVRLDLAPGARLDRDVVVVLTPAEPRPDLLAVGEDTASPDAPKVALAAFSVPAGATREAIALRLLVDCSGSMGGDSIDSARKALRGVLGGLTAPDEVSLTRFGSTVQHVVGAGGYSDALRERLHAAVDDTDASLGGTEMQAALESVFAAWPRRGAVADVLLITDGEVWQSAELVESARRSGHRVFAIGVGSSPAESVLRELAEATGGAAEFATPGEALHLAAGRMLARMRQKCAAGLDVDWGVEPLWQLPLPRQGFGGDTVLALAGFAAGAVPHGSVRLLAAGADGAQVEVARTAAGVPVTGSDLARIAAARRFRAVDEVQAADLALRYQLVTRLTHCVLVHERADEDRTTRESRLQRVPGMLAAGWGATGQVWSSLASSPMFSEAMQASLDTHNDLPVPSVARSRSSHAMDAIAIPAFLGKDPGEPWHRPALRDLVTLVSNFLARGGSVADLVVEAQLWELAPGVAAALAEADALSIGRSRLWLLLAWWVATHQGRADVEEAAAALAAHAADVDPGVRAAAWDVFDRVLGGAPGDDRPASRAGRLARGMARAR